MGLSKDLQEARHLMEGLGECHILLVAEQTAHKLESRLVGEISITSDMQMTPPLWQKVKRNEKAF